MLEGRVSSRFFAGVNAGCLRRACGAPSRALLLAVGVPGSMGSKPKTSPSSDLGKLLNLPKSITVCGHGDRAWGELSKVIHMECLKRGLEGTWDSACSVDQSF